MLQFVREIPIRIVIQGASSARRGFLFYLAAGFSKAVDPLSGMTVNLVLVDEWLLSLKQNLQEDVLISKSDSLSHAFAELMAITRLHLAELAEKEQALLTSLSFREERGWSFAWSHEDPVEEMQIRHFHYMELFPRTPQEFDLVKMELCWRRVQDCEADFQHEGFKILKGLNPKNRNDLHHQMRDFLGYKLASGSSLQGITLHYLGEAFCLTV